MPLDPTTVLALAASCAAHVAPDTMLAVARVESGLDPLTIGINGAQPRHLSPSSPAAAAALATRLIAAGRNIDLGLAQINVRNLAPLGLSVAEAFDPCRNLAASASLLRAGWRRSSGLRDPVAAMTATLSLYNTGTSDRGVRNGYVAKVAAAVTTPGTKSVTPPIAPPHPPAWQVFATAPRPDRFVLSPNPGAVE